MAKKIYIGAALGAAFGLTILFAQLGLSTAKTEDHAPAYWIERGQAALLYNLKDSESARFRNVYYSAFKSEKFQGHFACGEVNAKNGFGAYSGFRPFYAEASGGPVSIDDDDRFSLKSDFFKSQWNDYCVRGYAEKPKPAAKITISRNPADLCDTEARAHFGAGYHRAPSRPAVSKKDSKTYVTFGYWTGDSSPSPYTAHCVVDKSGASLH